MAKKNIQKKSFKKLKINKNKKFNNIKSSLIKKIKLRYPFNINSKQNKVENFFESEKIAKTFFDAQASIKLQCCICNKNITEEIKIILEPTSSKNQIYQKNLSFNCLCVNCFILKTKYDPKSNTYYSTNEITFINYKYNDYRILTKMSDPLFTEDWSLADEIKLIGAVEKLGLENWEDISKVLNKGKFECESHYYTFYYKEKDDYLINDNLVNDNNNNSVKKLEMNKDKENILLFSLIQNMGYTPFSENNNKLEHSIVNNNNFKKEKKKKLISQNIYDTLGFWSKRNEYDVEYKNEAEILLSELEFKDNDDYKTINMNYKILQNYNNILEEREERKKLVNEKNLFDYRKQINFDKKLSNEDREIYTNTKCFLKYLTKEQFYYMNENNILEKNIKALLNQLIMYQKLGCKTFDDIQKYINEVKKINNKNNNEINQNDEKMKLRESTINPLKKIKRKFIVIKKNKFRNFKKRLENKNRNK